MEYRQHTLWTQYGQLPSPQAVDGRFLPYLWRRAPEQAVFEQRGADRVLDAGFEQADGVIGAGREQPDGGFGGPAAGP